MFKNFSSPLKQKLKINWVRELKQFFSDNEGEYTSLTTFFNQHCITHLTSPPHTPEHNGISEQKKNHIVETGMTLLHDYNLPTTYWTFAFQTGVYLINRMISVKLGNKSSYELFV